MTMFKIKKKNANASLKSTQIIEEALVNAEESDQVLCLQWFRRQEHHLIDHAKRVDVYLRDGPVFE